MFARSRKASRYNAPIIEMMFLSSWVSESQPTALKEEWTPHLPQQASLLRWLDEEGIRRSRVNLLRVDLNIHILLAECGFFAHLSKAKVAAGQQSTAVN